MLGANRASPARATLGAICAVTGAIEQAKGAQQCAPFVFWEQGPNGPRPCQKDDESHLRVNAASGAKSSATFRPAACSAVAAAPGVFSHGSFAWMARVTGSPSAPPKSTGQ